MTNKNKKDYWWIYLLMFILPWGFVVYKGFTDPDWDTWETWIIIFVPIIFLVAMWTYSKKN